jgi:hypothetical protein
VMSFLRSEDFGKATEGRVDQSKICVSGGSAGECALYCSRQKFVDSPPIPSQTGGWLALLVGLGVGFEACGITPPAAPTSIAAIYPISDLNDPYVAP